MRHTIFLTEKVYIIIMSTMNFLTFLPLAVLSLQQPLLKVNDTL